MAQERKNPAAVVLAKRSAKGRIAKIPLEQRAEIARNAAMARWAKKDQSGRATK